MIAVHLEPFQRLSPNNAKLLLDYSARIGRVCPIALRYHGDERRNTESTRKHGREKKLGIANIAFFITSFL